MTLFNDLWRSYQQMPLWVRIWITLVLIPVNLAGVAFYGNPYSVPIAILAACGIIFNLIPMLWYRGFTDAMAVSHVLFWMPLIAVIAMALSQSDYSLSQPYRLYLYALLACNVFSLIFDLPDTWKWLKSLSDPKQSSR